MRLIAALLTVAVLTSCGLTQTNSEQALVRYDEGARRQQAELDAKAILQGMAQARQSLAELARSTP